jgi:hypothetical protein
MLTNYNTRINLKLIVADTTNMLSTYLRKADTSILNYVNTYGTAKVALTDGDIAKKIEKIFDMRPYAIEQRLKVINYPFTFIENPSNDFERKIDTSLKDKFINNEEFIKSFIGILIEYAYKNYSSNTISMPSKVKEQNNLYFDENNPVKDFLNDCCEITNNINDIVKTRDLYLKYNECNIYKSIDEKKFVDLMTNLNKIEKKKIVSGFVYRKIKFIGLKNDDLNFI